MGTCNNSVTVDATSDQVWDTIKDFHDMSWATGVITQLEKVGDSDGSTVGARRILNDAFHETLVSVDNANKRFTYTIDDGPGPVAKDAVQNYVGVVSVSPGAHDNTALVEWRSDYESPDDQAVGDFCNPIYQALLSALKNHF